MCIKPTGTDIPRQTLNRPRRDGDGNTPDVAETRMNADVVEEVVKSAIVADRPKSSDDAMTSHSNTEHISMSHDTGNKTNPGLLGDTTTVNLKGGLVTPEDVADKTTLGVVGEKEMTVGVGNMTNPGVALNISKPKPVIYMKKPDPLENATRSGIVDDETRLGTPGNMSDVVREMTTTSAMERRTKPGNVEAAGIGKDDTDILISKDEYDFSGDIDLQSFPQASFSEYASRISQSPNLHVVKDPNPTFMRNPVIKSSEIFQVDNMKQDSKGSISKPVPDPTPKYVPVSRSKVNDQFKLPSFSSSHDLQELGTDFKKPLSNPNKIPSLSNLKENQNRNSNRRVFNNILEAPSLKTSENTLLNADDFEANKGIIDPYINREVLAQMDALRSAANSETIFEVKTVMENKPFEKMMEDVVKPRFMAIASTESTSPRLSGFYQRFMESLRNRNKAGAIQAVKRVSAGLSNDTNIKQYRVEIPSIITVQNNTGQLANSKIMYSRSETPGSSILPGTLRKVQRILRKSVRRQTLMERSMLRTTQNEETPMKQTVFSNTVIPTTQTTTNGGISSQNGPKEDVVDVTPSKDLILTKPTAERSKLAYVETSFDNKEHNAEERPLVNEKYPELHPDGKNEVVNNNTQQTTTVTTASTITTTAVSLNVSTSTVPGIKSENDVPPVVKRDQIKESKQSEESNTLESLLDTHKSDTNFTNATAITVTHSEDVLVSTLYSPTVTTAGSELNAAENTPELSSDDPIQSNTNTQERGNATEPPTVLMSSASNPQHLQSNTNVNEYKPSTEHPGETVHAKISDEDPLSRKLQTKNSTQSPTEDALIVSKEFGLSTSSVMKETEFVEDVLLENITVTSGSSHFEYTDTDDVESLNETGVAFNRTTTAYSTTISNNPSQTTTVKYTPVTKPGDLITNETSGTLTLTQSSSGISSELTESSVANKSQGMTTIPFYAKTKSPSTTPSSKPTQSSTELLTTATWSSNETTAVPGQTVSETTTSEVILAGTTESLLAAKSTQKMSMFGGSDAESDDAFWPVVAALVIGIPSIIVFAIAITVIHKRRLGIPSRFIYPTI